ncbi:MAG: bifunctional folylpolyglutamate synthase/dihydrofolate synthase [Gemmataceae bacterium]
MVNPKRNSSAVGQESQESQTNAPSQPDCSNIDQVPGIVDYDQAIEFWFGRINYERRSPRKSDLKLDRTFALLEQIGNPHQAYPIVHVAGSKGKGSTAAMLASVLSKAGHRTGLFTSPHLTRVEERFQINGESISSVELTDLVAEVAKVVAEMDRQLPLEQHPTFFEIGTALGFLFFARRQVDVAVIEVGLGGRFDSTNVCDPTVAIITSISLDHVQQLGNHLASIAREKAGIIKPNRPTISGVLAPEARVVIEETASERSSELTQLGRDIDYRYEPGVITPGEQILPKLQVTTRNGTWPTMELGLLGEHQAANAALAFAAVEELRKRGFSISEAAVSSGLRDVHWPARLEVVSHAPLVVLDCAHNRASCQAGLKTLETTFGGHAAGSEEKSGKKFLVFASSRDKDVSGMFEVLAPHFDSIILTCFQDNPRCLSPEDLASLLETTVSTKPILCYSTQEAWVKVTALATAEDTILITGSVFLAGEFHAMFADGSRTN